MDLNVGVTCLDCASGNNILAGCVDGTVKILDGRLRSQRARYQQSVQAVSTNVRKVKMNDNQHLVAVSGGRGEVVTFDTRMTGRACHAIELSPAYVDVAVLRWQAFTGQTATHAETGASFEQTTRRTSVSADG